MPSEVNLPVEHAATCHLPSLKGNSTQILYIFLGIGLLFISLLESIFFEGMDKFYVLPPQDLE